MIVLAFDTCLGACSAALTEDGEPLAIRSEPMMRGHQERLAPMVRCVMDEAQVRFGAVDRIGITIGPGSFTGLRVGLAFAKGLALALARPCIGVGTLEALAEGLDHVAAIVDAGRGGVYLQVFDGGRALSAPENLPLETAAARIVEAAASGDLALTGPGAFLLAAFAPGAPIIERPAPSPQSVARLAALAAAAPPRPLYLRAPDARVKSR